jgi:hypothetical protein
MQKDYDLPSCNNYDIQPRAPAPRGTTYSAEVDAVAVKVELWQRRVKERRIREENEEQRQK